MSSQALSRDDGEWGSGERRFDVVVAGAKLWYGLCR